MDEYIKRDTLVEICENQGHVDIDDILSVPAADVTPVVHGHWVKAMPILGAGNLETRCSVCGRICYEENAPYCYCGAKMDK